MNVTNVIKQNNPRTICDTKDNRQKIVKTKADINLKFFSQMKMTDIRKK